MIALQNEGISRKLEKNEGEDAVAAAKPAER
jgi:hypothetical protein